MKSYLQSTFPALKRTLKISKIRNFSSCETSEVVNNTVELLSHSRGEFADPENIKVDTSFSKNPGFEEYEDCCSDMLYYI